MVTTRRSSDSTRDAGGLRAARGRLTACSRIVAPRDRPERRPVRDPRPATGPRGTGAGPERRPDAAAPPAPDRPRPVPRRRPHPGTGTGSWLLPVPAGGPGRLHHPDAVDGGLELAVPDQ